MEAKEIGEENYGNTKGEWRDGEEGEEEEQEGPPAMVQEIE